MRVTTLVVAVVALVLATSSLTARAAIHSQDPFAGPSVPVAPPTTPPTTPTTTRPTTTPPTTTQPTTTPPTTPPTTPAPPFVVTITVTGPGSVDVRIQELATQSPGPFTCEASTLPCTYQVPPGATTVLDAQADSGGYLASWSSPCNPKSTTCQFQVNSDVEITVTFNFTVG